MRLFTILRIIGFFFMSFSLTMIGPIIVSLIYKDGQLMHFLYSMLIILSIGIAGSVIGNRSHTELRTQDGFLVVVFFWVGISMIAALPFILGAHLSFVDALFESISAFTTTGATVITGIDDLPKSIAFYRQQLQWFGGMGMVVLAVAVLPMIKVGGMQLYKAEAPGPMKGDKITPRLAQTAQVMWLIYLGITAVNALAYWLAGMNAFDAISHAFSTVSTGGFSTHDASLAYYNSSLIEGIAVFFMLMGAINFSIHFVAWRQRSIKAYFEDIEVRSFLLFVAFIITLCSLILFSSSGYSSMPPHIRNAVFEVVSVVTSTGFATVDFTHWPTFLPVLLIFISFVGGCGGSTAGGIKVVRVLVLIKMGWREIRRLIHPSAIIPVKLGEQVVGEKTQDAIFGFWAIYIVTFTILMLMMMQTGLDQVSAFSAIATSMNNLGPGLGVVASTFTDVTDTGKMIAAFAMLLGRLEIFTILVLLTPEYWRS